MTYHTAILSFLRRQPINTPYVTLRLAVDTKKPGFDLPPSGYVCKTKFAAWYGASNRALATIKRERRL